MSEGNIRINKVLRELNISLERAVDYLKDKGIVIEASPNTKVSDDVYSILCGQFAGDKGNKEASKGVSEEIRKEKEALRIEREKEIEDKRKLEEERQKQHELIKAKATVIAPKQVGKIDLKPKESAVKIVKSDQKSKTASDSSVSEKPKQKKEVVTKKEEVAPKVASKEEKIEAPAAEEAPIDETHTTQYQNLSGPILTGQKIDLAQFNKTNVTKEEEEEKPKNKRKMENITLVEKEVIFIIDEK